ncbi:MAG TPA: transporter substrate-binding domain-containing protein [Parachlamydiaceae bacterium]|nr:transporter substrate-binding domain-containing protein [Parachlamydiaceae bacterium]
MYYFIFFMLSIFSFTSTAIAEDLVVGTTSGYAPYVSLNADGDYEGFDIDVAKALADKLGRRLVIKDFGSMPALILALKQNKADALIWSISITPERQNQMAMVYYQGEKVTSLPLLFWGDIPDNIKGLEDLANNPKALISVEAGSFQENVLVSVPGLNLKLVDKVSDAILELKYGKSLAVLVDNSMKSIYMKKFPKLKSLDVQLPESQQSMGVGICINPNSKDLIAAVEKTVNELFSDGTIAILETKWKLKE